MVWGIRSWITTKVIVVKEKGWLDQKNNTSNTLTT